MANLGLVIAIAGLFVVGGYAAYLTSSYVSLSAKTSTLESQVNQMQPQIQNMQNKISALHQEIMSANVDLVANMMKKISTLSAEKSEKVADITTAQALSQLSQIFASLSNEISINPNSTSLIIAMFCENTSTMRISGLPTMIYENYTSFWDYTCSLTPQSYVQPDFLANMIWNLVELDNTIAQDP